MKLGENVRGRGYAYSEARASLSYDESVDSMDEGDLFGRKESGAGGKRGRSFDANKSFFDFD